VFGYILQGDGKTLREGTLAMEISKEIRRSTTDDINDCLDGAVSKAHRWIPIDALPSRELEEARDDTTLSRCTCTADPDTTKEDVQNGFYACRWNCGCVAARWRENRTHERTHEAVRSAQLQQLPQLPLMWRPFANQGAEKRRCCFCNGNSHFRQVPQQFHQF
jgi:hypothetical protein